MVSLDWLKKKINEDLVIDSLEVARNKFPGLSNSLDALCKRFGIDLSKRTKHNALLDCELLREVYINLLDAKEPKLNLSSSAQNPSNNANEKINYSKNIYKITDIEQKSHKEFLKSEIKKNYYWFFLLKSFSKSTVSFIFIALNPELWNKNKNIFLISE